MSKIQSDCPFYEGIDACNVTGCNYNILGGCFKKGSANYDKARDSIKPMTNYEKIKNMSIEELAMLLNKIATCCNYNGYYNKQLFCKECPINCGNCSFVDFGCWLNSEVEE